MNTAEHVGREALFAERTEYGATRQSEVPTGRVVEMLLKDQSSIDTLLRTDEGARMLVPKLLAIAMCGFALYGIVATAMLNGMLLHHDFWMPGVPDAFWNRSSAANLTLAYCLGLIAANGICLPSFYFYGLLAGIRITMTGIVAHALKGMAAGAVVLVGIVPIYVAVALSGVVFSVSPWVMGYWTLLALALPFMAGIWGAVCLYRGFICLADTLPAERAGTRTCFLRRLILAWSGCYTFVTPLVIYSLWQHLARVLN